MTTRSMKISQSGDLMFSLTDQVKKYTGTYILGAYLFYIEMDPISNFSCRNKKKETHSKNPKLWYVKACVIFHQMIALQKLGMKNVFHFI